MLQTGGDLWFTPPCHSLLPVKVRWITKPPGNVSPPHWGITPHRCGAPAACRSEWLGLCRQILILGIVAPVHQEEKSCWLLWIRRSGPSRYRWTQEKLSDSSTWSRPFIPEREKGRTRGSPDWSCALLVFFCFTHSLVANLGRYERDAAGFVSRHSSL